MSISHTTSEYELVKRKTENQSRKDIKKIVRHLAAIHTHRGMERFIRLYGLWRVKYHSEAIQQSKDSIAKQDIKKTMALIDNALNNTFHYITIDRDIHHTSNLAESFFSRLKGHYKAHNGLSEKHIIQWLKWWCFFNSSTTK